MTYKTYEHQPPKGPFWATGNFYIGVPVRLPQMAIKAPLRAHCLPVLQLERACL